ncbi:MAG TPA: hypothetical protein VLT61_13905 [Anaeromyxobacteraceae bacterium]|nr:hypothetical protein [Anaeromyxobacteraceae bacterium]
MMAPVGAAFADAGSVFKCHRSAHSDRRALEDGGNKDQDDGDTRAVPEFDPTVASSVAAMLMGSALLLARRRTR